MNEHGLFDSIVSRLGDELKAMVDSLAAGSLQVGKMEHQLQALLRGVGRQAAGVLLESADRRLCATRAVHDHRTRTFVTLFGPVDVTRSRTKDRHYPLDEALGIEGRHGWTASVQEVTSLLGCERSFESVCDLLDRLLDISISSPAVEQIAESAGERAKTLLEDAPPPLQEPPGTLILAVDGCCAPERDGWHEVKVACVYGLKDRIKTASKRGKLLHKEYLATLEDSGALGKKLWNAAVRWKAGEAHRVAAMGDGAPWIWNLYAEHFPGAIEIVDFYHAAEHLWATGEALHGDRASSCATKSWVRHYLHHLRHGRVDLVILAIERGLAGGNALPAERLLIVRRNRDYFKTNHKRMRYALFKRWGLPIGTGAVEGSCKFMVQSRFKLPGCRWSHAGLERMLALKQLRLNGQWERLWPFRQAA
jgi:hypothetical protein